MINLIIGVGVGALLGIGGTVVVFPQQYSPEEAWEKYKDLSPEEAEALEAKGQLTLAQEYAMLQKDYQDQDKMLLECMQDRLDDFSGRVRPLQAFCDGAMGIIRGMSLPSTHHRTNILAELVHVQCTGEEAGWIDGSYIR